MKYVKLKLYDDCLDTDKRMVVARRERGWEEDQEGKGVKHKVIEGD